MNRSLAFVWSSMVLLGACGQDFSSAQGEGGTSQGAGTTSSSGSGGGTSTGTGVPNECPDDTAYVPPVPAGWTGPIIVSTSADEDALPDCPESGGDVLHMGLVGDEAATCPCACGLPNAELCSASVDIWTGNDGCSDAASDTLELDPGCLFVNNGGALGGSMKWTPTPPAAGACEASAATPTIPEVSWSQHLMLCEVTPVSAGSDQCAPLEAGFDSTACVVKEGSEACPEGYSKQRGGFTGWLDNRGCAEDCSCDTSSVVCSGHIWLHSSNNCSSNDLNKTQINPDQCQGSVTGYAIQSLAYQPIADGACSGVDGTPIGTVQKTGMHSLCCTN